MYLAVTMVHKLWSPAHLGTYQKSKFLGPTHIDQTQNPRAKGKFGNWIFSSPLSELDIWTSLRTTTDYGNFVLGPPSNILRTLVFQSPGIHSVGLECGPGGYISYKFPGTIDAVGLWSLF